MNGFSMAAWLVLASALAAQVGAQGDDPKKKKQQDFAQAKRELLASLGKQGIEVDLAAKTITVRAVVNEPADPLEYLLIHKRGKSHEALFVTDAKPSLLNSAFILLGCKNGKNATYKEKDPPPTEEEIAKGADWVEVFPPEGMKVWMTVSWTDGKGEKHVVAADDLIVDLTAQKVVRDNDWIYLGGSVARIYRDEPPVFVADFEGNLVSICYLHPPNHLVTMRHERARDDQNWWMTKDCPDAGTEVKLTFHRVMPDVVKERMARITAEKEREAKERARKSGAGKKGGPDKAR